MRALVLFLLLLIPLNTLGQNQKVSDTLSKSKMVKVIATKDTESKIAQPPAIESEELTYDKKLALGIAVISLALSIFNFVKQSSLANDNRDISRIEDAYKKWTDKDFISARRWVMESLPVKYPQAQNESYGYYNLKKGEDDDVDKVTSVSIFFDYIGLFMHNRLFNERLFWEFWGEAVIRYWYALSPYLYVQRKIIRDRYIAEKLVSAEHVSGLLLASDIEAKAIEQALQYQKHFEDLAIFCEQYSNKREVDCKILRKFRFLPVKELRRRPIDYLE